MRLKIPKNTWNFLDFPQKSKNNTWKFKISKKCKISKKTKISKTIGLPKNFWKFWISMWFYGFSAEIPKTNIEFFGVSAEIQKTHGHFWIFSRNPKNTWTFLDFQQKSKKNIEFFGFSAEIHQNTWKSKISRSFWCAH